MKRNMGKRPPASSLGIAALAAVIGLGLAGCASLQSIEVSSAPVRTVFGQGQELDSSGLAVIGHFKKESKDVTSAAQISGYDKSSPGQQTLTVTYTEKKAFSSVKQSATFTVTVVPVESISISQPPAATSFKQGDDSNWNGLSVGVKFEKDAVPGVIVKPGEASLTISGYNKDKPGAQSITVDYYGKRAAFEVKVVGLDSIVVTSQPRKIEYYTGEEIDLTGLVVSGTWSDKSTAQVNITKNDLSGFDITRNGKQNVTVTFSGKTTTFPVTYIAFEALSVDRPPTKTKYELGEKLDTSGIRILGTWPGHSMSIVNNDRLKITGYDPLRAGDQRITVTVGGQSDSFTVTVINPFEGVWSGQWKIGSEIVNGQSRDIVAPVTLTMEGSAWTLRTRDNRGESVELRGVYTADSSTHAKLQCDDNRGAGEVSRDSSTVMRLRNGLISGVTLDKGR
ncbi:MAG: bacterial Ig-like domain-containing protein [Spirochaetaceae bacterium]|nr:bacterial Ig-like domain-containing protein [Spirochaetaceae bacterium]